MAKTDVSVVVVGLIAAAIGYLAVDQAAASELTNWLRQEIRKEVPTTQPPSSPNYTPVIPSKGL
jgi:hypothetical protein